MSHARWTLSPVAERETAHSLRILRRQNRARFGTIGSILVGGVVLGLGGLWMGGAFGTVVFLIMIFGSGFAAIGLLDHHRASRSRANALFAQFREEFGSGVGTLVRLRMLQGDAPTGEDVGMLWIDEGRLLFAGRRTSFALGPSQVRGPCKVQPSLPGLRHPVRVALGEQAAAGPLALSLEPIDVEVERLTFEIDRWARTIGSPGQMPPAEIGPDAPSPVRLLAGAVYATGLWAFVLTAVVLSRGELVVLLLFAAILAPRMGASAPLVRWRAFRDRRRIG